MMALEEEFNREISDEEAERVITVQDAIDLVRKKTTKHFTAG
jgi:acyl carrier protein